jgi:hypothetical protein
MAANYSAHNIVLELLVSVGIVGTAIFVVALVLAAIDGNFQASVFTITLIGVLVGMSIAEVVAVPGRTYLVTGLGIYLFVAAWGFTNDDSGKSQAVELPSPDQANSAQSLTASLWAAPKTLP